MPDIFSMALQMIQRNPQRFANSPMAQQAIQILQSRDAQAGEQFANNLLQTYGISREEALQRAQRQFGNIR